MNTTLASTDVMTAVVSRGYGPPESLEITQIPRPAPKAHEVLVRNHASVVTHAVTEARRGPLMARLYFGLTKPKWPVLGTNFAGTVIAISPSVTRFAVGDRVTGINVSDFGAHAEYIVATEDGVIVPTPAGFSDVETVAVFDGSITALPFIRDRARLSAGQSILINGAAGAVGSAAVQLAKHYGANVTAVCSTGNMEAVRALGADHVIDYSAEDFTQARDAYNVVFDSVGKSSFARVRRSLTRDGLYLTTVPSVGILARMLWSAFFGQRKAAILFTGLAKPAEMARNFAYLRELVEQGALVPLISSVHPIEQAAESHRVVETGHKRGSAVITFDTVGGVS
ncbi:NAD(P)-dependent alcohol dehydrogenase [Micromonospora sp. DT81.3]|uniref:NAD(P)-dependent alcohol dehydrogenase n=1 Tax=Micromonospora sp. DT81.3 TaxID=3416523 RepID=UPI003CF25C07